MKSGDKMESELEKRDILRLNNKESNRLTRECLQMALAHLMAEKDFDKISITELVKRAGVSRTAFYRNYESKEAIIEDIGKTVVEVINCLLQEPEYHDDPVLWYKKCFQIVQEHSHEIRLMINAGISQEMMFNGNTIIDYMYPSETSGQRYYKLATEAAFRKIFVTWFEDGMKETPEEMATLCSKIFKYREELN